MTDRFELNPMEASKAPEQMSDKDNPPPKSASWPGTPGRATNGPLARESGEGNRTSATSLEFGPDGEVEFKGTVPRRRDDVLKILKEEAAHAAGAEQQASVQPARNQAWTADDSKAVRSANSQLIVRTGTRRDSDGSGLQKQANASSGWLRAIIFMLVAIFAIAAFAFHFAADIGTWAPWLQPYLAEYIHGINRFAVSFGELI